MRLAAALLAVTACGGTPAKTSTPVPTTSATSIENHAPPRERDTPPPTIAFADSKFAWTGLPAVAKGGELAIVPISGGDAGRGYPNLELQVHDRSDHTVETIHVMTSNEFERLAPGGAPTAALQKRIEDANTELARLHGVHDVAPMHALEIQKPADGSAQHLAIGDGYDVDWNTDHLHVLHHNTDHELVTLDAKPWLVKDHTPCPNCTPCENPAFLDGVYHAEGVNLLVVQIGYRGTDTCWEPADQMHVVTW